MAKGDRIPDSDEVTRWIKRGFLGKTDDGNVVVDEDGRPAVVSPAAFALREDEETLSLTWLQFFAQERAEHLPLAAEAHRNSLESKTISATSAFAVGRVDEVLATGQKYGNKLRVLHEPCEGNDGHSEIRRYPAEMGLLQLELAERVFLERHLYCHIQSGHFIQQNG